MKFKPSTIRLTQTKQDKIDIQDLSAELKEITEGKTDWINRYCPKEDVGKAIYRDFVEYNREKSKELSNADDDQIQYIFSEDLPREGILSDAQAFQSIACLFNEFGMFQKESNLDKKARKTLIDLFTRILDAVNPEEGVCIADTSPYLIGQSPFEDGEYAYLDTLTWVITSILDYFRLYINGVLLDDSILLDRAIYVYQRCITYISDSYIDGKNFEKTFSKGWNFTKDCNEPSLYFTFTVSETVIDILSAFENVVRAADIDYLQQEIDRRFTAIKDNPDMSSVLQMKKEQIAKKYEEHLKNLQKESGIREKELFLRINGCDVYDDNSPYKKLEDQLKASAANIWAVTKENIHDSFYSSDLSSTISEGAIVQSSTNEALFNSVYVINCIINAGLDEDASDMVDFFTWEDSEEKTIATREYDDMCTALRMAYDNVWQFYNKLKKENREYKINEYVLAFDETFKNSKISAMADTLRKARIRVFSLLPLLVKTKSVIGEFVIQYPQYDMVIYLEKILENRVKSDGAYYWVWEKDCYSTSSNFYFVTALAAFYRYYEEYEYKVIKNATDNAVRASALRKEGEKKLREALEAEGGDIYNLKKIITDKETQIEAERQKYTKLEEETAEFRADPLKYGMWLYIQKLLQERIAEIFTPKVFGSMLTTLSGTLANETFARVTRKTHYYQEDKEARKTWYDRKDPAPAEATKELEDGIANFVKAMLSEQLAENFYERDLELPKDKRLSEAAAQTRIEEKLDSMLLDLKRAVRLYSEPIVNGFDEASDYVKSDGYEDILPTIEDYRVRNPKDRNAKNN